MLERGHEKCWVKRYVFQIWHPPLGVTPGPRCLQLTSNRLLSLLQLLLLLLLLWLAFSPGLEDANDLHNVNLTIVCEYAVTIRNIIFIILCKGCSTWIGYGWLGRVGPVLLWWINAFVPMRNKRLISSLKGCYPWLLLHFWLMMWDSEDFLLWRFTTEKYGERGKETDDYEFYCSL